MFYICIEWYPGGYVICGKGPTEAEALAELNECAQDFPEPPPVFTSVQELRNRFHGTGPLGQGDPLSALYAGEDEKEFDTLADELLG